MERYLLKADESDSERARYNGSLEEKNFLLKSMCTIIRT